jgi:ribonucleoside-triphosphate reductase (thioredoxin)
MNRPWSNLARVVYQRTYSRADTGTPERWADTVERTIAGNARGHDLPESEIQRLRYFLTNRKATPAGRGLWYSGSPGHARMGGVALCNCWGTVCDDWKVFVLAQDLLMLGGGVGMSVEHQYVSKLPRVKKGVEIWHKPTKDADFIVPDSREGWNELLYRVLEAFFSTGKSFCYSTVCVRGAGEPIAGFGGKASGPGPLVSFIEKLCTILRAREGRAMRPIDAADVLCADAEMVVSGNVRRSALLIAGDPWDKEFLKAKRWDLGPIPSQRSNANFSVVAEDVDDLHPLFWDTYQQGEPFGIVNRANIRKYGRMGELKKDTAVMVNPCAEATLEPKEPCNLQEIALPNLDSVAEFEEAARLMHRWGKRVTMEHYHHSDIQDVVERNRRVGTGITGCLQAPQFFNPKVLDRVYAAVQDENVSYSRALSINPSIRTTVVKPSGTLSKMFDIQGEGLHSGFSRYMIQRVRFAASDPAIPLLRAAGHHIEPVVKFDGTMDHGTLVVDFYVNCPDDLPTADEGFDTWQQLDTLLLAQRHWADQAVSVTVYYRKDEVSRLKAWLSLNLRYLKTISFLCWNDHGFKQAPKESISRERYEELQSKITPLQEEDIQAGEDIGNLECVSGSCPVR